MKRFFYIIGMILIIPWHTFSQEPEFLSKQDFQAEKKKLLESIYQLNRANNELQTKLLIQAADVDSLALLLSLQAGRVAAQQDSLNQLQTIQADLDGRLLTQRKSGTLIAILVPLALFLFTVLLLIWFVIFRHRTLAALQHLEEQQKEQSKRLDDQLASHHKEHETLKQELLSVRKELDQAIQALATRMDGNIQRLEQAIQEEKNAHNTRHQEANKEVEEVKETLKKGVASLSKELGTLKEEVTGTVKEITARIRELAKSKPG